VVVIAPGCALGEAQFIPNATLPFTPIRIEMQHGSTVVVSRAALPGEFVSPLKATAKALHIAPQQLADYGKSGDVLKLFSSEFVPADGEITFGPFAPGTYALKILDANGKVLWEETRLVQ
jgi:hypothetical protein